MCNRVFAFPDVVFQIEGVSRREADAFGSDNL